MSSTDKDICRFVPYRFIINDSAANICKLEKLTNLFPDLKPIIELGIELDYLIEKKKTNKDDFYSLFY